MRDGNPDAYSFRINANFADMGFVAEGPLGKLDNCSWIAAFRKSYLQYILQDSLSDPSMAFGIQEVQGRLNCRITPKNSLSLEVIGSNTTLDLSRSTAQLGANNLVRADQRFSVAHLGWQFTPSDKLLITNHVAFQRDSFSDSNPFESALGSGNYREWVWNSNATWMWNSHDPLLAGSSVRSLRDSGYLEQYNSPSMLQLLDRYHGSDLLAGVFLGQSWSRWKDRVRVTASGRWDHDAFSGRAVFLPQLALMLTPFRSTHIQLGWGQYAQFPEVSQFGSYLGGSRLLPQRSMQSVLSLEQRLSQRIRMRATFYNRQDRNLLFQPLLEPRVIDNVVFNPPFNPLLQNSVRGYARGAEFFLQRASANGLSGWLSYSYGRTGQHDGFTGLSFPSDLDQRHSVNAYASYRIRPTVNLSARWTYGSGFPVPGFIGPKAPLHGSFYYLSDQRNQLRYRPTSAWISV